MTKPTNNHIILTKPIRVFDNIEDAQGKSVPKLMYEASSQMLEMIAKAGKVLDEQNIPKEGRVVYNPETGEFMKMPENKCPVTQPGKEG